MRIIKRLRDDVTVCFNYGNFDEWCVYVKKYGKNIAPNDVDYFTYFQNLIPKYGQEKIYNDFLKIYNQTTKNIDLNVRTLINDIVSTYDDEHQKLVEENFTVIWGGMIAEENKDNTKLGKRVKHLGVYQTIIEKLDPLYVANFSKGKSWTELDEIMKTKNI